MSEKKRQPRRDKVQIIDDTIAKIDTDIKKLESKIALNKEAREKLVKEKEELLAPKVGIKDITSKIKNLDLPLDEVMKAVDRVAKKQQKQAQAETQKNIQEDAQGDS